MRPSRSMGGGRGGSPLIPSLNTAASKLAVGLIVGSIIGALAGAYREYIFLVPELTIHHFFLWTPLTYAFIETSPMGVIFGALILWSLGGALEMSWGSRRTLRFAIGVMVATGITIVLLALAWTPLRASPFVGGAAMASTLWVAYGLSYADRQTNFWGLPVTGNQFALIGVGFVALNAIFGHSVILVLPDIIALLFTFVLIRFNGPSVWLLRFQSWRLQQKLKRRGKHLTVIGKDRNHPSDSDRYLQ